MSESKRQLAAIMFTDIVSYTSIMGENEARAFEFIERNRSIQKQSIEKHNGSWLKEMGDGTLSSFTTVSDAVACAIEIQEASKGEEFQLRIGIHLGEVVMEGGDVFGDGVNIASRIESFAPAGGILVSESVHQNVRNKPGVESEFVREAELKNVSEPVRLYEIKVGGKLRSNVSAPVRQRRPKKPLLFAVAILVVALLMIWIWLFSPLGTVDRYFGNDSQSQPRSLAILPFTFKGNDNAQQYLANGVADALHQHLARIEDIQLINEYSVDKYSGISNNVRKVASELEVRYLLLGDLQINGNDLKVAIHLIDSTEKQLLFQEFTGSLEEIFTIQQQIVSAISEELNTPLSNTDKKALENAKTQNLDAYLCYLQGRYYLKSYYANAKESDFRMAMKLYGKATQLDNSNASACADLGLLYAYKLNVSNGKRDFRTDTVSYFAKIALDIDPNQADAHYLLGWMEYLYEGKYKKAIRQLNRSVKLNPNHAWSRYILGNCYRELRQWENARNNYRAAEKLDKGSPLLAMLMEDIGTLYLQAGDYGSAEAYYKRSLDIQPDLYWAYAPYNHALLARGAFEEELALVKGYYQLDRSANIVKDLAVSLGFVNRFVDSEKYWEKVEEQFKQLNTGRLPEGHRYAYTLWNLGKKSKARRQFRQHVEYCEQARSNKGSQSLALYDLAAIQAFLGKEEEAIDLLNQFEKTDPPPHLVSFLQHDPLFAGMKENETIKKIISNYDVKFDKIRQRLDNIP